MGEGRYGAGTTDCPCTLVQQWQGETVLEQTPQREGPGEEDESGGEVGRGRERGVTSGCYLGEDTSECNAVDMAVDG